MICLCGNIDKAAEWLEQAEELLNSVNRTFRRLNEMQRSGPINKSYIPSAGILVDCCSTNVAAVYAGEFEVREADLRYYLCVGNEKKSSFVFLGGCENFLSPGQIISTTFSKGREWDNVAPIVSDSILIENILEANHAEHYKFLDFVEKIYDEIIEVLVLKGILDPRDSILAAGHISDNKRKSLNMV